MRQKSEIEDRIRFLLVEELERRVENARERLPHRCTYNYRQPLDTRKQVEGEANPTYNRITTGKGPGGVLLPVVQTIGLCMYGVEDIMEASLTICEDPIDAQRCPLFVPERTKAELWLEYSNQIASPVWLKEQLPEVYALYWVLESAHELKAPWWLRVFYRFLRIRPEPLRLPTDLVKLLPPPV